MQPGSLLLLSQSARRTWGNPSSCSLSHRSVEDHLQLYRSYWCYWTGSEEKWNTISSTYFILTSALASNHFIAFGQGVATVGFGDLVPMTSLGSKLATCESPRWRTSLHGLRGVFRLSLASHGGLSMPPGAYLNSVLRSNTRERLLPLRS